MTASQFDRLFADGDSYEIGTMTAHVMHTPGHTPACMTHVIGDAAFVGDTLFMPDGGSARADFPGGDARTLYRSIQRRAGTARRDAAVHVPRLRSERPRDRLGNHGRRESGPTISMSATAWPRTSSWQCARRATRPLRMPKLIIPSLQVNMRGGQLPPEDKAGKTLSQSTRQRPCEPCGPSATNERKENERSQH